MSNRILSFLPPSIQPYLRTKAPREPRSTPPVEVPAPPAKVPTRESTAPVPGPPLSPEEHRMIAREFPQRPELSLRLYGPGSDSRTVTPKALGGRLDLRA